MSRKVWISRELPTGEWHRTYMPDVAEINFSTKGSVFLGGNAHLVLLKDAPKLRLKRWKSGRWEIKLY